MICRGKERFQVYFNDRKAVKNVMVKSFFFQILIQQQLMLQFSKGAPVLIQPNEYLSSQ